MTSGNTKSCGHLQKERLTEIHNKNIKDITGQKFGLLTALYIQSHSNGVTYWKCVCECGNEVDVRIDSLIRGNTFSCGCLKSKGEAKIAKILRSLQIKYKQQYSFKDLLNNKNNHLYFDFALLDDNNNIYCLIEYQGIQHYIEQEHFGGKERFVQQQINDNAKRIYCQINNIPLIEISYKDFNKIDNNYLKAKLISKGVWL